MLSPMLRGMLRNGTALAAAAVLAACATAPGAMGPSASAGAGDFTRLTETLEGYVEDGKLAGGVVQIMQGDELLYADAFGWRDIDGQVPMTEDTIFRIASQTKAIVTVGALILQEEGKLTIQDPISKYLPEWADVKVATPNDRGGYDLVPVRRPITIRDLMTHTSGIGYGSGFGAPAPGSDLWEQAGFVNWYFADKDQPIRELVRQMAALPMPAQPGERWIYGYNVDILGAIVEVASGMPLDAFLKDRIFDPLGMTDTQFYLRPDQADRLVTIYSAGPNGVVEAPVEGRDVSQGAYVNGPRRAFSGGAGLTSTAHDYTRFLQMLLNYGELDGVRVLSRKTVELMTVNHLPANIGEQGPGTGMGLGVSVLEDLGKRGTLGSEGEFGWGGAYHSTYWVDPAEGLTVVYFTNIIPAGDVDDFAKLRTLLYQAIE
jgi:CubicO group peptidase (beta-lactamase class C family)